MKINTQIFKIFPVLKTERLFFRKIKNNDLEIMHRIRSDEIIAETMGVKKHNSLSETEELIKDAKISFSKETAIWWILCLTGNKSPIGYAGIWNISKTNLKGELGYALAPVHLSKGYMTEALTAIINFSFNSLKLHRLEADIDSDNKKSISLLKKFNFKQDAFLRESYLYNGKFRNSVILSKLENENY